MNYSFSDGSALLEDTLEFSFAELLFALQFPVPANLMPESFGYTHSVFHS